MAAFNFHSSEQTAVKTVTSMTEAIIDDRTNTKMVLPTRLELVFPP
jgi:hypothetical protein